jgi:probable phosphoglycerate mutase
VLADHRVIILIRHGESEHHVRGLTGGWTDTPLTEAGHEQAHRLAARLRAELGDAPIALYTSDLVRASGTAGHIAEAFGVEATHDDRLREHNNGEAANMTMAEARERYAEQFARPWTMDDRPFPGCESFRELYARAAAFLDDLPAGGGTPVVVSHGFTLMYLVAKWLRLPPEAMEPIGFSMHPTSITTLVRDRFDNPWVERMNDVSHLGELGAAFGLDRVLK